MACLVGCPEKGVTLDIAHFDDMAITEIVRQLSSVGEGGAYRIALGSLINDVEEFYLEDYPKIRSQIKRLTSSEKVDLANEIAYSLRPRLQKVAKRRMSFQVLSNADVVFKFATPRF